MGRRDPFGVGVWAPKQGPRDLSDLVGQGDSGLVPVHAIRWLLIHGALPA